jgi:hypothetical protein
MTLADLIFSPQGTTELDLKSFDCGRESVNKFFREEAQDYHAELFLLLSSPRASHSPAKLGITGL